MLQGHARLLQFRWQGGIAQGIEVALGDIHFNLFLLELIAGLFQVEAGGEVAGQELLLRHQLLAGFLVIRLRLLQGASGKRFAGGNIGALQVAHLEPGRTQLLVKLVELVLIFDTQQGQLGLGLHQHRLCLLNIAAQGFQILLKGRGVNARNHVTRRQQAALGGQVEQLGAVAGQVGGDGHRLPCIEHRLLGDGDGKGAGFDPGEGIEIPLARR